MERVRHLCRGCGASCTGVAVRPVDDDERRRLEHHARLLGVAQPLEHGRLRLSFGRCVFLDGDFRCRLHARFGADAKPRICQQFPFVSVRVDGALRRGVDPGCLHGLGSGGDVAPAALLEAQVDADVEAEALLADVGTLSEVADRLGWSATDVCTWITTVPLHVLAQTADLGPLLREAAGELHAAQCGPIGGCEHEASLVDGMQRMVSLGLLQLRGAEAVRALLAGVVVAAWRQPTDPRRLASAWFRIARLL